MDFAINETEKNTETVTISRAEYEAQQAKIAKQDATIAKLENQVTLLMDALRLSKHKQFGASSEKSNEAVMEQLSYLFNEAEAFASANEETTGDDTVTVPEHQRSKKSKKNEYTLDSVPDDMTEIGMEVVRKLKIKQAEFVVEEHRYHTYACQTCNKADIETPVVKAPHEKNIIPGSFATPEVIAHIMTQKFVMGCPLYRQEQELNRRGIKLSRQTMSNWIL